MKNNNFYKKELGQQGESAVASWLTEHGFKILATNFRTRCGEVDIIASRDDVVSFVEVKTRKNIYFPISQVITTPKQHRIALTAQMYALANHIRDKVLRFDVAVVTTVNDSCSIAYIENAFSAP